MYCEVLLPIAIRKAYTYAVPDSLVDSVAFGKRVEVNFGKTKIYSGLIVGIIEEPTYSSQVKSIISVLDPEPLIKPMQFKFWQWIADYYLCPLGEVMNAALPSGLKLSSDTSIIKSSEKFESSDLADEEFLIMEALETQEQLSLDDVSIIVNKKSVSNLVHQMMDKQLILLKEELQQKYKPRTINCVRLNNGEIDESLFIEEAFEMCTRSQAQTNLLLAFIQTGKNQKYVSKKDLSAFPDYSEHAYRALIKKGILESYKLNKEINFSDHSELSIKSNDLVPFQKEALHEINGHHAKNLPVLLYGVTGSGKTRIYVELIKAQIERGKQVLYLLPEIAISAQLINRLKGFFGQNILVYHSRLNQRERVESWKSVLKGGRIVVGVRSSIFLPFQDLGLVIIDESHDQSLKQQDPAPRYHARDSVLYLTSLYEDMNVIMGTATPSIESFHNSLSGKLKMVTISERYGGAKVPKLELVNISEATQRKEMFGYYSKELLVAIEQCLAEKEQVILFQNRRGFAPTMRCTYCGWNAQCKSCDISLTYHKHSGSLNCHYCGRHYDYYKACPQCGRPALPPT